METRRLGTTGLELSVVGIGTAAAGGTGWPGSWGNQPDELSVDAIVRAVELGANWIDTAPVYGFGHAESVVREALAQVGGVVRVLTKCGVGWKDGKPSLRLDAASVRRDIEASLERLGLDAVDMCLIHFPESDDRNEEGWAALAGLVGEGLVRHAGVSNFGPEQLRRLQSVHPVAVIEAPYSLLDRESEASVLPFATEVGAGVVVYRPLAGGLLAESGRRERFARLDAHDWRRSDPAFVGAALDGNLAQRERLAEIADGLGVPVERLAVAWVLRKPVVTAAIVGFRTPGHAEQLLPGFEAAIDAETVAAIERALTT